LKNIYEKNIQCLLLFIVFLDDKSISFYRSDNTVRTVYYNKMNMAHSSTIDWTREPMSSMAGMMNTLAEDMQW
jgi:hypothetical protein